MASLCRVKSGRFDIADAYSPDYIKSCENPESLLISCEDVLKDYADKKITLDGFYSKLAKNGAEIYIKKLKYLNCGYGYVEADFIEGGKVLMYDSDNILFALGEIKNYDGGLACKAQIFV